MLFLGGGGFVAQVRDRRGTAVCPAVAHVHQHQTQRGRGHAREPTVASGEDVGDFLRLDAAEPGLDNGSGDTAAHFVEESVAFDDQVKFRAAAAEVATGEGADGAGAGVAGVGGEGGEVVASDEVSGGVAHGGQVEGAGNVPGAVQEQWVHGGGVPDSVAVLFAGGLKSRVEIGAGAGRGHDPNVGWEVGVEGEDEFAGGHAPFARGDIDMGDQAKGMDAGVGPAGAVEGAGAREQVAEGVFDQFLDSLTALLGLPALVTGAVVSDTEPEADPGVHGFMGSCSGGGSQITGVGGLGVEVALQKDGRGGGIDPAATFLGAFAGLGQHAVGLEGGETFVPGTNGDGDGFLQEDDEFLDLAHGGSVGAVHVAGQPDQHECDFAFLDEFLETVEELGGRFGGQEVEGVREHAEFVTDGDADADGTVIESENAHGERGRR